MSGNKTSKKEWTNNEVVEMMNKNTSDALIKIAEYVKGCGMGAGEIIELLIDASDEMAAQAIIVSMRDELKFEKPKDE